MTTLTRKLARSEKIDENMEKMLQQAQAKIDKLKTKTSRMWKFFKSEVLQKKQDPVIYSKRC